MATFPVGLPRPQLSGYRLRVQPSIASTERERPAARMRRTATEPRIVASLIWIFTTEQFATFAEWWRTDLADGATAIDIQLPVGTWDSLHTGHVTGPYQADDLVGRWRVSLAIELHDLQRYTSGELATLLGA